MPKSNENLKNRMYTLVLEYESGNVSQKEFCKSKGLKLSYLNYWIGRYRKDQTNESTSTNLIPIHVEQNPQGQIRIITPQGMEIHIPV